MFTYAKKRRCKVGLWTNGVNLSEELSREIIEEELLDYVIFSLDAATKETYAKVKGVDAFDKTVENITGFLELKKEKIAGIEKDSYGWWEKAKPIVGLQILKMKETDSEIEEFMNRWDYLDKVKKMINYRNRWQEIKKIENEGEKQQACQKLETELWEAFYTKTDLPVEHAIIGHFDNYCDQIGDRSVIDVTPLKRFPCKQLKSSISLLWSGDVVLCRHDFNGRYPLGNLKDQSLSEILEGERLEEIQQLHKDGKWENLPLCKDCKEWYYNLYA
jgi:radical SAM protein with 4Fe4S-binding SPASM domain